MYPTHCARRAVLPRSIRKRLVKPRLHLMVFVVERGAQVDVTYLECTHDMRGNTYITGVVPCSAQFVTWLVGETCVFL